MNSLPEKMTAIAVPTPGGPEALVAEERPLPVPGEREILVRVHAAGVNRPDVMQRKGQYPPPPGAPDIPGLEIAGEVVGPRSGSEPLRPRRQGHRPGPGGGYAEYCKVIETSALPMPAGFSMVEAAAIPETFFTVWPNLFDRGRLRRRRDRPHPWRLVGNRHHRHPARQGLRRAPSSSPPAARRSARACLQARRRSRDQLSDRGFRRARQGSDRRQGRQRHPRHRRRRLRRPELRGRGRRGAHRPDRCPGRRKAEIDLRMLMAKRLLHTGSTLRPRPFSFKAEVAAKLHEKVWPLFEARKIAPVIDTTFPLTRAADAHARMEVVRAHRQDRADGGVIRSGVAHRPSGLRLMPWRKKFTSRPCPRRRPVTSLEAAHRNHRACGSCP